MDLKKIAIIAIVAMSWGPIKADDDIETKQETIVEHINSNSDSIVFIIQPKEMDARIAPTFESNIESKKSTTDNQQKINGKTRVGGYRIQVFSDNNAHTAKSEAQTKASNISSRFPQYRTYIVYNSPYWRLKVGDFLSEEEAYEAIQELKRAFPAYGKEMRIVRDWVSVTE